MSGRAFAWPDGKRIAVTVNAMLETWSEGKAPPYGVQASHRPSPASRPLRHRLGQLRRQGRRLAHHGAAQAPRHPRHLLRQCALRGDFSRRRSRPSRKQGHDVAGHGYLQDELQTSMTPDEEQAMIRRCLDILERATGQRPQGWISPVTAFTAHTRDFLAEDKLLWHGDARDTDLPSVVTTERGPIVQIPGSDFTDNRTLRSSPQDLWDVYTETFDYLREKEAPALLAMSMHCHFGGRPLITAVFEKIFDLHEAASGRVVRIVRRGRALGHGHAARRRHPRAPADCEMRRRHAAQIHAKTARRGDHRLPRAHPFPHRRRFRPCQRARRQGPHPDHAAPRARAREQGRPGRARARRHDSARAPPIRRSKWRCISRSTAAAPT